MQNTKKMTSNTSTLPTFSCTTCLVLMLVLLAVGTGADFAEDSKGCGDKLTSLSPCLSFVSGETRSPALTCCTNLRQEINTTKKCLCILVKDRDDPHLGYKINATLALSLPSICHAPANISECLELLHLAPNSPDAQVFEQFVAPISNSSPQVAANPATESCGGDEGKRVILRASMIAFVAAAVVGL